MSGIIKGTSKAGPGKAGALKQKKAGPTQFRRFYERGDFPIALGNDATGKIIMWKVEIEKLDYHHYLPLFFDGLCETTAPYDFFARRGILDMLTKCPGKVVSVIPQLIIPIKNALNTRNPTIVAATLIVLQKLVLCDGVGAALVPYYRQILPVLNIFRTQNMNSGDGIDYGQQKRENLGDLIEETLAAFEVNGGPDAFINIKYMVPTWESVVMN